MTTDPGRGGFLDPPGAGVTGLPGQVYGQGGYDPWSQLRAELAAQYAPIAGTPVKRGDGLLPVSDLHPSKQLMGFYAALAQRDVAPVDILFLGDSITEGMLCSAVGRRWIDLARDRLRERFPVTGVVGGVGYVPSWYAFSSPVGQGFTLSGNHSIASSYGLGRRSRSLGTDTGAGVGKATITRTCSSFDVCYRRSANSGTLSIKIDGGAAAITAAGTDSDQTWNSGPLTPGAHTVEIALNPTGGSQTLEGVMFYNGDETKGIRMWEGAQTGTYAAQFNAVDAGGNAGWADAIPRINPDLVVMGWVTNDAFTGAGNKGAASYKASMQNVIDLVRTKAANVPVLLMPPYERNATLVEPWGNYLTALQQIASAYPNVAYADFGERIPKPGGADTYGLLADATHPNDKGYALMADAFMGAIVPR